MANLTARRFQAAKPIFDRYRDELMRKQRIDVMAFEQELKDLWDLGYQDLKPIMIQLSKKTEYVFLAARYMEGGSPGVVSEFQGTLADLYGVTYYYANDREQKQKEFWERAFKK
jgi:hypothetical protein